MASIDQRLSERFYRWELRGRGWQVFPEPVVLEPIFAPFPLPSPEVAVADDGRRPTAVSSWLRRTIGSGRPTAPDTSGNTTDAPSSETEQGPELFSRTEVAELSLFLPPKLKVSRDDFAALLGSVSVCREPVAFELVATDVSIGAQFSGHADDLANLRRSLATFFPDIAAQFAPVVTSLANRWANAVEAETIVLEFGLAREFLRPLAVPTVDPYFALLSAMSDLAAGESAVFQILFQPVQAPWAESIVNSVTDARGGAFFVNAPELAAAARTKTSRPLYATVLRIAVTSADFERTWAVAQSLAMPLRVFAHPDGNELAPLRNDQYPLEAHVSDLLCRQCRRSGMLLNLDELLGFLHLPSAENRAPKFLRLTAKTKAAPDFINNDDGLFLGWNRHLGNQRGVWLTPEQRVRHTHIIGASGTGKSTLLFNLIRKDIESGEGVALLDPHGDLVDQILGVIPPERIDDVILLDPSDENFSVGFNILSAHSDLEKTLLASDLVSVFQRLSTSWGDQMGSVLNNAILAFLESTEGGTLADLRRFLLEPAFREQVLKTVGDPDIVYYWRKGFSQLSGNKSIGPVLTRLETFLSPKPIRYMVSQPVNRLDFAHILDTGKIFLAKLSQGAIGKENSYLLGSLLMTKFQQTAMSRQRQDEASRRFFWLYLDEFHHFITPSMAEILSGARKYRVGLTLAHQELRQLQRDAEVASAVMSNCYTRVCFRVGDQDARVLESGFSAFEARDLQNLGNGEAICRVERSDFDFNLAVPFPERPDETSAAERRRRVVTASREKYAVPRAEIEAALRARSATTLPEVQVAPVDPRASAVKRTQEAAPPVAGTTQVVQEIPSPAPKPSAVQPMKPEAPAASKASPPADLGRGGVQHKAVQLRIKDGAASLGFRVFTEKPILDGAGSVDLVLERDGQSIACEITVTTTIDHEIGNVSKCIKAGFKQIALVALNEDKLAKLAAAVKNSLGADAAAGVVFFLPDGLLEYLRAIIPNEKFEPSTKRVRGYKVKTVYEQASPEEAKAKEDEMIQLMAEMMRRKSKP